MKRSWVILFLVVAAAAAGSIYWWTNHKQASQSGFQTYTVMRGDVQDLIPATGTVEPVEAVDVGAQVAGQVLEFGKDSKNPTEEVDYNSEVEKDSILAVIDPALYEADLKQSQAQLDSSKANLAVANANIMQYNANLVKATNDWERAKKLGAGEALAKSTYDATEAAYLTAEAQLAVGKAAVTQAEAAIKQAEASVFRAERNLRYTIIKSPVKGKIIDRRVNIGQTVVSSLNAPSLFLIATDLTKVQVWVAVNEAEIGRIQEGMPVTFTVDAYPDRVFNGVVGKVRLNATMTQNVVTYTVEVNADNTDNALIPYLTANVKFMVNEQNNVLLVPNAALRWRPRDEEANNSGGGQGGGGQGGGGGGQGGGGRARRNQGGGTNAEAREGTVYILDGGTPKAVKVQTGISDGIFTAVTGGDLKEGNILVTGYYTADPNDPAGSTNPFAPQFFRGGRGGGGGGGGRRGG